MATKRNWKFSKKGNKILFVLLGTSVVVAPAATIIYSLVAKTNYQNKDPWSEAIQLDDRLDQIITKQFEENKTHFTVGEKDNIGVYVTEHDISGISDYLKSGEWVNEVDEDVIHEMLFGTGARLTFTDEGERQIRFKGKVIKNLALFPTILEYPYNGEHKYGEIYFEPSNTNKGIFHYGVRFSLRLGIVDGKNNTFDLQKSFDYSLDHGDDINLGELLTLMNNEVIVNFVQNYSIDSNSINEDILEGLLTEYYNLSLPSMRLDAEISPLGGSAGFLPFNEVKDKNANAKNIHVKYDSNSFSNLDSFGAELFNSHTPDYKKIETIFGKIGISMPTFENDKEGYKKYDRKTISSEWENNFQESMSSNDVNSYKGYINIDGDGLEVTEDISDQYGSVFQSEHKVFHNKVWIKFLDINNDQNGTKRKPTNIFYDQEPYLRGSISYSDYNFKSDVQSELNTINWDTTKSQINQWLNFKKQIIEKNIEIAVKDNLSRNGVNTKVFDRVELGSLDLASDPQKSYPRNGGDKVYFDKVFNFSQLSSKVWFKNYNHDGSENGRKSSISMSHGLGNITIQDPKGIPKNDIGVLKSGIDREIQSLKKYWNTDTNESTIISEVKNKLGDVISDWINSASKQDGYPVDDIENYKINMELIKTKNNRLDEGNYKIKFSSPSDVMNFKGSMESNDFWVVKAPEPEPEPEV